MLPSVPSSSQSNPRNRTYIVCLYADISRNGTNAKLKLPLNFIVVANPSRGTFDRIVHVRWDKRKLRNWNAEWKSWTTLRRFQHVITSPYYLNLIIFFAAVKVVPLKVHMKWPENSIYWNDGNFQHISFLSLLCAPIESRWSSKKWNHGSGKLQNNFILCEKRENFSICLLLPLALCLGGDALSWTDGMKLEKWATAE